MNKIYLTAAFFLAAIIWHIIIFRVSPRIGLVKPNFIKKPIMASYGIAEFPYIAAAAYALTQFGYTKPHDAKLYLSVMGAMCILGAIDDIWGTREVGGFKGHFKKLLFEHKLTTGAVKAIGGGIVALAAGWSIYGHNILKWLIASAVIALATNTLNLFDLRPGRAVAVLFTGLGVTCMVSVGHLYAPALIGVIVVIAFIFGLMDSRGRAMMGDSGSNTLGAAMGLTIVLSAQIWMPVAIILLAAIHIYSEKHSISALIEQNRVLKEIDRRLGVR